ncbi:MAG: hypothetical protein F6K35_12365 [Okeania sp. SIO2H7]|nr:hypothetical protein [Okeania sp. SIO2H7]
MIFRRWQKILAPLLISVLLLMSACGGSTQTSRFEGAQQQSTQRSTQREIAQQNKQEVSGGEFNKFFPPSGGGYDRVFTQEKRGFAQAKLKQNGEEVAILSISDTAGNPSAVQKFQNASQKIGGYPAVAQGKNATVVLVGDRFQVKVQSRSSSFSQSDREAWLQRFDLNGLARL